MRPLKALAEAASEMRVPLALVLKSELGREILRHVAGVAGLVLQGGGAVHYVFGSPRFSVDLDFAQQPELDQQALDAALDRSAGVARDAWGACALEPTLSKGRLHRQKLRVKLEASAAYVLAVERYEVPVHEPETRSVAGVAAPVRVESPAELIADKLVAGVDRFSKRGMLKLRDVFDVAFLLDLGRPPRELVLAKLADYGHPRDPAPLAALAGLLDEVAAERLRAELRDVLPQADLEGFDVKGAVRSVRMLCEELAR